MQHQNTKALSFLIVRIVLHHLTLPTFFLSFWVPFALISIVRLFPKAFFSGRHLGVCIDLEYMRVKINAMKAVRLAENGYMIHSKSNPVAIGVVALA